MEWHYFSYADTFTAEIFLWMGSTTQILLNNTWLTVSILRNDHWFIILFSVWDFPALLPCSAPGPPHPIAIRILTCVYEARQRPAEGWKWPLQTDKRNDNCTLFFISCAYKAVSATLVYTGKALPAKAAKPPVEIQLILAKGVFLLAYLDHLLRWFNLHWQKAAFCWFHCLPRVYLVGIFSPFFCQHM